MPQIEGRSRQVAKVSALRVTARVFRDGRGNFFEKTFELFGLTVHPTVGAGTPLALALLSPAHREIQVTKDLPGFWAGTWRDVRKDMRGRYPKHPWPEHPATAPPTTRAKPRK